MSLGQRHEAAVNSGLGSTQSFPARWIASGSLVLANEKVVFVGIKKQQMRSGTLARHGGWRALADSLRSRIVERTADHTERTPEDTRGHQRTPEDIRGQRRNGGGYTAPN
ncbi:unnamed protein product [Fusarium graminearum]|uniref:Uncharacterized protein n=1 Tax=Gibberella zeae TaxID=5518 RepID=A0A9N8RF94_GIBZA|nr:unnamed protein product [Fusarium graminearum]